MNYFLLSKPTQMHTYVRDTSISFKQPVSQPWKPGQLGPSTLAVPAELSNGGGENVGHSPAESGTDFCAPLAPPCGH